MEKLYDYLPRELVTFLLVTVFSLLIGLSQRKISLKREGETTLFGTFFDIFQLFCGNHICIYNLGSAKV